MVKHLLALLAIAGCAPAEVCHVSTAFGPIDVVSEMPGQSCSDFIAPVQARTLDYTGWNQVRLEGWTAVIKPLADINGGANGGWTHWDRRSMEIQGEGGKLRLLVHELEHVRLGPDSAEHCGWESDGFVAWEARTTGLNETAYVASTCPGSP